MVKIRLIYAVLFITSLFWFIFHNESISFALLLACVIVPIALKVWLTIECRMLQIKIAIKGELCVNQPLLIRVAAVGKHHACIGKISGKMIFHHLILDEKEERNIVLLENGNLLSEDLDYQNSYCGAIGIKINRIKAYDCFGITTCNITAPESTIFLLLPEEEYSMRDSEKAVSYGDEFIGIRKYREGDYMSSIHWKISNKWDTLYVKEFSDPEQIDSFSNMRMKCQSCTSRDLCYNK